VTMIAFLPLTLISSARDSRPVDLEGRSFADTSLTMTSPSRAAIVTGAAQGIGRAIALRLAQDGFDVSANDLPSKSTGLESLAEEIRVKGRKAIIVTGDISQEQDVQILVDRTVAELGELYVMVANAGVGSFLVQVVDLPLDAWNRSISVNLTGTFLCYQAAARQMLKQGHGGRIIGASSALGKRGEERMAEYSATKFGVRGLTQALATELAKEGITVNAYAPGLIDTPILKVTDPRVSTASKEFCEAWINNLKDTVPIPRLGTPESVAGLVSYIVSDEADFMTGQSVSFNGGLFYD